jgi:stalled ribosome rescue protein Dom34
MCIGFFVGAHLLCYSDCRKRKGVSVLLPFTGLDFAFVQYLSEGFAAAFKKPNCELGSFSTLVFSSSHLPSFLGLANFLLAFGTFSHNTHVYASYITNQLKHFPFKETRKTLKRRFLRGFSLFLSLTQGSQHANHKYDSALSSIKTWLASEYIGRTRDRMTKMKQKKSYKRGYPVALLVGFESDYAVMWQVFSQVVKLHSGLTLDGKRTDVKSLYNFHESLINALRPMLEEGVRSVVITAPLKTTYAQDFLDHVQKHHTYLIQANKPNRANFAKLVGSADQPSKVAELVKTKQFCRLITETTSEEADNIVNTLEKHLFSTDSDSIVLYSLKEIEDIVYDREKPKDFRTEYLVLTDKYLADSQNRNRIDRLLQISKNKKVKTRVVNVETPAGKRISQFGGIVFFSIPYTPVEGSGASDNRCG